MAKKTDNAGPIVPQAEAQTAPAPGPILPNSTGGNRINLPPNVRVVQGTSASLMAKGARPGTFFIEGIGSVEQMRLVLIDADVPGRVMFPYDPKTGAAVMGNAESNKPWCGSNDGENPRQIFEGNDYIDWRDGARVIINGGYGRPSPADPNVMLAWKDTTGCLQCPLGNWRTVRDHKTGEIILNSKTGKQYQAQPPCQSAPTFVFYDLDRQTPVLMSAPSFMIRAALEGYAKGGEPGVASFYAPTYNRDGTQNRPQVEDADGRQHALIMKPFYKKNDYSGNYVPRFEVDPNPLTPEEEAIVYGTDDTPSLMELYTQPDPNTGFSTRDYLTGKATLVGGGEDPLYTQDTNLLEDGESKGVDFDAIRKRLGNGGERRIGGEVDPF